MGYWSPPDHSARGLLASPLAPEPGDNHLTALDPSALPIDLHDPLAASPPTPSRGRLVMLVDNTIDGDSRVQKSAMSAAAAGWETTLIGRSPNGTLHSYPLGGATVLRVPVPYTLHARRRRAPGPGLRWPLAYRDLTPPPGGPLSSTHCATTSG